MTSAKRRINSTGRKRIARERVNVRMHPVKPDEPLTALATLELSDMGFPPEALVVLEAYQRSSGMRFDCGTVGDLNVPPALHLNEIDSNSTVLFRLKVVDSHSGTGRILGSAERLRPTDGDNQEGRRSIFPIKELFIGDEVWRVDMDDGGPVLVLNCRILGFKHRILENPLIQGIILPAAFRIVLEKLAADPTPHEDDDEDWRGLWLRYLKEHFSIDEELSELTTEERQEWVDAAVRSFCQAHGFVERIRAANEAAI
jgi:hypothetical protein